MFLDWLQTGTGQLEVDVQGTIATCMACDNSANKACWCTDISWYAANHVSWLVADRNRPAQALEVDVQGEIASAISMAHDSNWSLPYLEEQIKQHKGDVNAIFHEVGPAAKKASHEKFRR